WEAKTLSAPVMVTFQVSVFPSAERVKVALPLAEVVLGVGRSLVPLRVAVNDWAVGAVPLSSSHAATKANAMTDKANNLKRVISPPLNRLKGWDRQNYSTLTVPFMNGCGTQW
ncbi:MAG TPA: hypothetical protein VJB15_02875, partial [Rhodothermia bacterium]|nr:hypothetical protein [Rhodothermia bacterium]